MDMETANCSALKWYHVVNVNILSVATTNSSNTINFVDALMVHPTRSLVPFRSTSSCKLRGGFIRIVKFPCTVFRTYFLAVLFGISPITGIGGRTVLFLIGKI